MNTNTKVCNIEEFISKNFDKRCRPECATNAKVLNSFFIGLKGMGFKVLSVWDGEEKHTIANGNRFDAMHIIFSVDDALVHIKNDLGHQSTLSISLDCDGAEMLSDISYGNMKKEVAEAFDKEVTKLIDGCEELHSDE